MSWYKEPCVWLVISLPVASVVASLLTIWIAVHNPDAVISKTIHKEGMFYKESTQ